MCFKKLNNQCTEVWLGNVFLAQWLEALPELSISRMINNNYYNQVYRFMVYIFYIAYTETKKVEMNISESHFCSTWCWDSWFGGENLYSYTLYGPLKEESFVWRKFLKFYSYHSFYSYKTRFFQLRISGVFYPTSLPHFSRSTTSNYCLGKEFNRSEIHSMQILCLVFAGQEQVGVHSWICGGNRTRNHGTRCKWEYTSWNKYCGYSELQEIWCLVINNSDFIITKQKFYPKNITGGGSGGGIYLSISSQHSRDLRINMDAADCCGSLCLVW